MSQDQQHPPLIEERILDACRAADRPLRVIELKRSPGLSHRSMADIRRAAYTLVARHELVEGWLESRIYYARDSQRLTFALPGITGKQQAETENV